MKWNIVSKAEFFGKQNKKAPYDDLQDYKQMFYNDNIFFIYSFTQVRTVVIWFASFILGVNAPWQEFFLFSPGFLHSAWNNGGREKVNVCRQRHHWHHMLLNLCYCSVIVKFTFSFHIFVGSLVGWLAQC